MSNQGRTVDGSDIRKWIEDVSGAMPSERKDGALDLFDHNEWYIAIESTISNLEEYGLAHGPTDAEIRVLRDFLGAMDVSPEATRGFVDDFLGCPVAGEVQKH